MTKPKTVWLVEWHGGVHSCRCRQVFATAKAAQRCADEVRAAIDLLGLLSSEARVSVSEMELAE